METVLETLRMRKLRYAKIVASIALVTLFFLFVSFLLKRASSSRWSFSLSMPVPAQALDLFSEGKVIREIREACISSLRKRFPDLCGLSALHFGYNVQYACFRRTNGDIEELLNPELYFVGVNVLSDSRMVGESDPMCAHSVQHVNSALYHEEVAVKAGEGQTFVTIRGREARCVQKLFQLMKLTTKDDWPCTLSKSRDWEPLNLYSL